MPGKREQRQNQHHQDNQERPGGSRVSGYIGIMENEMETTIIGYIGIIGYVYKLYFGLRALGLGVAGDQALKFEALEDLEIWP